MAKTARKPIPGAAGGDPTDDGNRPESASPDPVLDLLIREARSCGIDNPSLGVLAAVLVHEIELQCNDLVQYQRTIADGIENAGNQVRDMRIMWNEVGPEPSISEQIVELLVVSFVVMPLMSKAVSLAMRFAARPATAVVVAKNDLVFARLKKLQASASKQAAFVKKEMEIEREGLRQAEAHLEAAKRASSLAQRPTVAIQEIENEVKARTLRIGDLTSKGELQAAQAALATIEDRLHAARMEDLVTPGRIQDFFKQQNEKLQSRTIPISGRDLAKSQVKKLVEAKPEAQKGAATSTAVDFESLAQTFLRKMERYFENIKANAQAVFNVSRERPTMLPAGFALLHHMHDVLAGTTETIGNAIATPEQLLDLKQRVSLDAEHKMWAMLIGDEYKDYVWTDFDHIGPSEIATMVKSWMNDPPERVMDYFRGRFYEGKRVNNLTILYDFEQIRKNFLKVNENALAGQAPIEEKEFVFPTSKAD